MYADQSVREISHNTVPLPTTDYASFDDDGKLTGGSLLKIYTDGAPGRAGIAGRPYGLENIYQYAAKILHQLSPKTMEQQVFRLKITIGMSIIPI